MLTHRKVSLAVHDAADRIEANTKARPQHDVDGLVDGLHQVGRLHRALAFVAAQRDPVATFLHSRKAHEVFSKAAELRGGSDTVAIDQASRAFAELCRADQEHVKRNKPVRAARNSIRTLRQAFGHERPRLDISARPLSADELEQDRREVIRAAIDVLQKSQRHEPAANVLEAYASKMGWIEA